jgi:hypothetical protein
MQNAQMVAVVMDIADFQIFVLATRDGMEEPRTAHLVSGKYLLVVSYPYYVPFHYLGECPYGTAWADTPIYTDTAHQSAECSNYGICDRSTGKCQCFNKFSGPACERGNWSVLLYILSQLKTLRKNSFLIARCPNDCTGHGICSTINEATYFMGSDYDSRKLYGGDGYGPSYSNWDSQSITICECEDGYFGPDCSLGS